MYFSMFLGKALENLHQVSVKLTGVDAIIWLKYSSKSHKHQALSPSSPNLHKNIFGLLFQDFVNLKVTQLLIG